jgi:hypothetical protein
MVRSATIFVLLATCCQCLSAPLVTMSARVAPADSVKELRSRFDNVIGKPFDYVIGALGRPDATRVETDATYLE